MFCSSAANERSWSTMVLIVFFSSRISPFTSTVILRDRSPRATAVVTSAMFLTCVVRLAASGSTNRQIATALCLSERTVEEHVARALRKLGLRSRRQLRSHPV